MARVIAFPGCSPRSGDERSGLPKIFMGPGEPGAVHVYTRRPGMTTITAVDFDGAILKEVSLPTEMLAREDIEEVQTFLARHSHPSPLRLV